MTKIKACDKDNAIPKISTVHINHLLFQWRDRSSSCQHFHKFLSIWFLLTKSCTSCGIRPLDAWKKSMSGTQSVSRGPVATDICFVYSTASSITPQKCLYTFIHPSIHSHQLVLGRLRRKKLQGKFQAVWCLTRRWQWWRPQSRLGLLIMILVWH